MEEKLRAAMEAVLAAAVEFNEIDGDESNGTTAKSEHWAKFRRTLDAYSSHTRQTTGEI